MNFFIQGFLLGLGAAVPVGPINIIMMTYALRSYTQAFAFGFGAMCADSLYIFLLSFGLLKFFNTPLITQALSIFGFVFLIAIAIMTFKGAKIHIRADKKAKPAALWINFLKGFLLTLTNPYTVGFWLSTASIATANEQGFIFMLLGLICAIFGWITLMPLFIYKKRHFISDKIAKYLSILSAIILIFFAIILALNAIKV